MRYLATGLLMLMLMLMTAVGFAGQPGETDKAPSRSRVPAVDFRQQATPYSGPGFDQVTPAAAVEEVLIGYFGPSDPNHPVWGDAWRAAQLAIAEANENGGYQGKPFRLVPAWSQNPWTGTGVGQLARLAYHDRVWAIIGGLDGNTAHLAEQVAAKARLPLLCALSTDRTANAANVPWILSMMPGDHLQAPLLVQATEARASLNPRFSFSIASASDHDGRAFTQELDRALQKRNLHPTRTHVFDAASPPSAQVADQILQDHPSAVVIAANAATTAGLARQLREAGYQGLLLGRSIAGTRAFLEAAGPAAEGFLFPAPLLPENLSPSFQRAFENQAGYPPDATAAYTYDGVKLVVAAAQTAGLSRARIGQALRDLAPWPGATGLISWDSLGSNVQPPRLAVIQNGRITAETLKPTAAGLDDDDSHTSCLAPPITPTGTGHLLP